MARVAFRPSGDSPSRQEDDVTRQIGIDRRNDAIWVTTLHNPPVNLIDLDTIGELQAPISDRESG